MGSGVSCCCGGKSVDVIATNTNARPWMKDEATGPDDPVSVDAIYVSAKKGGGGGGGGSGSLGGGSGGGYECSCGTTGNGMVGGSGSGTGGRLQHCSCNKHGGVGARRTCVHDEGGSGYGGGCPVDGGGVGSSGGTGVGGGGVRSSGGTGVGGGVRFSGGSRRGGAKVPRPVRRSATFVKPATSTDTAIKQHAQCQMPERRRAKLRHSESLTSSQFPNLANLLGDNKTTQRNTAGRSGHRGQQAPKNNTNRKSTTRDHDKAEYNVSAQRTPKYVVRSEAKSGTAGALSFSRYNIDSDTQLATSHDPGTCTFRLTTPGRGFRDDSFGQQHGTTANGVNAARPRGTVSDGSQLDVRGHSATLYSKDVSHIAVVEGANNTHGANQTNSNATGSTGSETGSSGSDAHFENRPTVYKKAEGFFLPIDSLVPPTPQKTLKKKKKKKGTAFVITFNDSGIDSASIEGENGDNTSSDDDTGIAAQSDNGSDSAQTTQPMPDPITKKNSLHENRAAYKQVAANGNGYGGHQDATASSPHTNLTSTDNRSKHYLAGGPTLIKSSYAEPIQSRSRKTPVPVKNVEGDFGSGPYGSVGQSFRANYLRDSNVSLDPVSKVRDSYQTYQLARRERQPGKDTRRSVGTNGANAGHVDGSETRRRADPLADVSAYLRRTALRPSVEDRRLDAMTMKRHINDLRFLLSHRLSQQTRKVRTGVMSTASNTKSKFSDALVKSFQEEIVRLETELHRTESKLKQTTSDSNSPLPERDVTSEEHTDKSTTSTLKQHLNELAELDHDFANQLQQAQEQLSDDEIRDLLDAHVRRRQEVIEKINAELNGAGSRPDGLHRDHGTESDTGRQTASVQSSSSHDAMVNAGCEAQTSGKRDAATGPDQGTRDVKTTASQLEASTVKELLMDSTTQASDATLVSQSAMTDTGTSTTDGTVGENTENNDKLSRSIAQMVDGFSQDTRDSNDMFVQTTWTRREQLSPDDFNQLLSDHLSDIQSMRRIRENESRKLNETLERRKMNINRRLDNDDEDLSENSEEETGSDMNSESEDPQQDRPRVDRLPTTREELETLLAEHVERQRQLLAMKATKRQTQNDKLKQMLQRQGQNKARQLSQSESDEFDYSDTHDNTRTAHSSPDASDMSGETTHEKTAQVTENADDLIRAHRDRRENLQRWRDEDKKLKNEKLQEKLSERLKQKK